jgi:hypothetical protein
MTVTGVSLENGLLKSTRRDPKLDHGNLDGLDFALPARLNFLLALPAM